MKWSSATAGIFGKLEPITAEWLSVTPTSCNAAAMDAHVWGRSTEGLADFVAGRFGQDPFVDLKAAAAALWPGGAAGTHG